jgi:hypothetical protein
MYINETAQTAVNPASSTVPQVIETTTLPATDDEMMLVQVIFTVNSVVTSSTAQTLSLAITIGANTQTFPIYVNNVTGSNLAQTIFTQFAAISRAGDVINAQLQGGASADTHTTVNVIGFYVFAISGLPGGT